MVIWNRKTNIISFSITHFLSGKTDNFFNFDKHIFHDKIMPNTIINIKTFFYLCEASLLIWGGGWLKTRTNLPRTGSLTALPSLTSRSRTLHTLMIWPLVRHQAHTGPSCCAPWLPPPPLLELFPPPGCLLASLVVVALCFACLASRSSTSLDSSLRNLSSCSVSLSLSTKAQPTLDPSARLMSRRYSLISSLSPQSMPPALSYLPAESSSSTSSHLTRKLMALSSCRSLYQFFHGLSLA